jgi:UDP-N-acetylmuramoyl-L-alanyl-D-glutamate--2,6-diaminopimelate ligase
VPEGVRRWTYGRSGTGADLTYEVLATELGRSRFLLRALGDEAELELPMLGTFHGANALAAIGVGLAAGYGFQGGVDALRGFPGVPGRVERITGRDGRTVYIDYAHDPHAFDQVLGTARASLLLERPGAKLVTVFGCGGDRDRGKRPLMLEAALRSSDRVFVTSDNPRREDPRAIVRDILDGLPPGVAPERVVVEMDRAEAIRLALASGDAQDVVMVLGKGHEPHQIIGDRRVPYSEHAAVRAALDALGGG